MAKLVGTNEVNAALARVAQRLSKAPKLRVGFLANARYPDGKSVALIAAIQDGGAPSRGILPRPFFRNAIAKNKNGWAPLLAKTLKVNGADIPTALRVLGEVIVGQIKQSIQDTNSPPLKPATIKRKGFAKPLIYTAHMQNSVDFEIK